MLVRLSSLFVLALLLSPLAAAQPSASKIRADVRSEVSGRASNIKLTGNGTRARNRGVWEYRRSITYQVPLAEVQGASVEYYGDMVYQGGRFQSFRPSTQKYIGIPAPSEADINAVVMSDLAGSFPLEALEEDYAYEIVSGEDIKWEYLNAIEVPIRTRSKHRKDANTLETIEAIREVQMTRDGVDQPWRFVVGTTRESRVIATETRAESDLDTIRRLFDVSRILKAEAEAASVIELEVKPFENDLHLALVTYRMLREADPATLEAYLRKVMSEGFYERGSRTALNDQGRALIALAMRTAHGPDGTYGEYHCESPAFDFDRTEASGGDRKYILSIVDGPPRGRGLSWSTEIVTKSFVTGYENGQEVHSPWYIHGLSISLHGENGNLAWLRSFDDRSQVCPNDVRWRQTPLGQLTPTNHE